MIRLTYDQAVDELLKAVKTRGEMFIYPEDWRDDAGLCRYVLPTGAAGCIVGQVFHQIVGDEIRKLEGRIAGPRVVAELIGIDLDPGAEMLLGYAQEEQDKSERWGYAASYAILKTEPERETKDAQDSNSVPA